MAGDKCPWVVHDLSPRLQSSVEYAQPKNISRGIYMYIYIYIVKVTDDQGPDKKSSTHLMTKAIIIRAGM